MVTLISMRESMIAFYQKKEELLRPLFKVLLSLAVLCLLQTMFKPVDTRLLIAFLVVSFAQAFLPLLLLYFSGSALIAYNLWMISPDICLGFVLLFLICLLTYIRMEPRTACITILVPVLFYLRMEYLIPVILGMTVGFSGIFPAIFGTLIYYMMLYTGDASSLLTYSTEADVGTGLSRVVNLMVIDRRMLILLVTFTIVIFITSLLYHMFYELAWLFSVTFGNAAMVFLMLCGRYIFELDYSIWRLFLEAILSIALCSAIQFFRGLGDISRMEKTSFEDDDYIYYVKAVPKIRVAQKNRNITNISSEMLEDDAGADTAEVTGEIAESEGAAAETPASESGELRRRRRAERKRIFGRKRKPDKKKEKAPEEDPSREELSGEERKPEEPGQAPDGETTLKSMTAPDGELPDGADQGRVEEPAEAPVDDLNEEAEQSSAGDRMEETEEVPGEDPGSEADQPPAKDPDAESEPSPEEDTDGEAKRSLAEDADREEEPSPVEDLSEDTEQSADEDPDGGVNLSADGDVQGEEAPRRQTFADAVLARGSSGKIQKLDMEDILKENIAAAKELSLSDAKRQGKE